MLKIIGTLILTWQVTYTTATGNGRPGSGGAGPARNVTGQDTAGNVFAKPNIMDTARGEAGGREGQWVTPIPVGSGAGGGFSTVVPKVLGVGGATAKPFENNDIANVVQPVTQRSRGKRQATDQVATLTVPVVVSPGPAIPVVVSPVPAVAAPADQVPVVPVAVAQPQPQVPAVPVAVAQPQPQIPAVPVVVAQPQPQPQQPQPQTGFVGSAVTPANPASAADPEGSQYIPQIIMDNRRYILRVTSLRMEPNPAIATPTTPTTAQSLQVFVRFTINFVDPYVVNEVADGSPFAGARGQQGTRGSGFMNVYTGSLDFINQYPMVMEREIYQDLCGRIPGQGNLEVRIVTRNPVQEITFSCPVDVAFQPAARYTESYWGPDINCTSTNSPQQASSNFIATIGYKLRQYNINWIRCAEKPQ